MMQLERISQCDAMLIVFRVFLKDDIVQQFATVLEG